MAGPWAGYVRVSHVGGRGGESFHAPDDQAGAIEGWAARRGEPVEILPAELDESGGRRDRPILEEAIRGIEEGRYRGLAVAYLSRASRSTRHMLELWDRIEAAGGEVHAVAENLDTSTPAGRLTRTMLAAIAEHELDLHRERFEELRARATAAGVWQRRQVPRGYVKDPGSRRLVPGPDAGLVRRAFAARAAGAPVVEVADLLGMTPSGARQLLANRVYLGELRVGAHVNEAAHPAVVGEDVFEAVQAMRSVRPGRGAGREPALLAGLARCCGCGHVMPRSRSGSRVVYACVGRHSLGRCEAPAAITAERLDAHVAEVAVPVLRRIDAQAGLGDPVGDRLRLEAAQARREFEAFLQALEAAGMDPAEAGAAIRTRRDRDAEARARLAGHLAGRPPAGGAGLAGAWEEMGVRQRNQVLRGLLECVLVERAGRGRTVPPAGRARLVVRGAGIAGGSPGGEPRAVVPVGLPDRDDPRVLRPGVAQDGGVGVGG